VAFICVAGVAPIRHGRQHGGPRFEATATEAPQNTVLSVFETLLASGELLESSKFQEQMGWTRQALSKAALASRVF